MNEAITDRITAINQQLDRFCSAWVEIICTQLPAKIDRQQLQNILAPGLDLIKRGGKRWRPLLMLLCGELAGGGDAALPLTPLIEIAHNGSLIADDIEDNSLIRRGGAAIHLKYGLDVALNTGNFMCFLPSLLIEQSILPSTVKFLLYKYYLEDLRNLHIGQGLDIQWHNNHNFFPEIDEYFLMCSLKTGTLARLAARLGILAGGGSEELAVYTGKVCEAFGVGFQIIDDVKNLTTGNPGKKHGDDIIEGKKSLPVILLAQSGTAGIHRMTKIFDRISHVQAAEQDNLIEEAIAILNDADTIVAAKKQALTLIDQARTKITEQFPVSTSRSMLLRIFDGLS